ncbi:MAG: transporter [Actinobacteria bacterium]|nr:transporter [Actinomycetota bacterium]
MLLASISGSVDRAFTVFFAWLPALLGAIVVVVIGYFIAKLVGKLVYRVANKAGLDRTLHSGPGGGAVGKITRHPSKLLGTIAFWAILLSAISLAVSVLHIKALTAFIGAVWAYLPNVIAALAIFIVAGLIATAVAGLAKRVLGDTGIGRVIATAVPILVMTIATFMILDQLRIAHNIVVITYAALLGAIALGSALAFGLGGRAVAERMLEGAYASTQENKEQWKRDLDHGLSRAKDEAANTQDDAWSESGTSESATRVERSDGPRYAVTDTPAADIER